MASYYSKPADYGTYTQPINLELVNFVLSSKQQKYDYNLAKLDDKITNQLGAIDLVRAEDKEYFLQKASDTLNSLGDVSKVDLSNNGVTRQINARLNSIVDERVLTDIISTKNYRQFQSTLQEKQKETPELYSSTNAAFAMETQGVNSWLKGESESVGSIDYEDYVDIGVELRDISENLDKYANVVRNVTKQGNYFVSEEGEVLSSGEVRSIAEQLMSDKAKRQMEINGWRNYDAGGPIENVGKSFKEFSDVEVNRMDTTQRELQAEFDNLKDTTGPAKDAAKQNLESWTNYASKMKSRYSEWNKNPEKFRSTMTSTMEKERVLNAFGDTFQINNMEAPKFTLDAAYYKDQDLAFKYASLAQKTEEAMRKYTGDIQVAEFQNELKDVDLVRDIQDKATSYTNAYTQGVSSIYNGLTESQKTLVDEGFVEGKGQTKAEHRIAKMRDLANTSSNIISLQEINAAEANYIQAKSYKQAYSTAVDKGFEELENTGLDKIVETYSGKITFGNLGIDAANTLNMLLKNGNVVGIGTYLKRHNIKTGEDLNAHPEVKNQILKSYYADKLLSEAVKSKVTAGGVLGLVSPLIKNIVSQFAGEKEEAPESNKNLLLKGRLVKLFDGDLKATNSYLEKAKKEGLYDKNKIMDYVWATNPVTDIANIDNSVNDNNKLESWITTKGVGKIAGKYLEGDFRADRQLGVVLDSSSAEGQKLARMVSSSAGTFSGATTLPSKSTVGLTIIDKNADYVEVSALVSNAYGTKQVMKTALVPKANLSSTLLARVNFSDSGKFLTKETMVPVESRGIPFFEASNVRRQKDVMQATGIGKDTAAMLTKEGNLRVINSMYPELVGTHDKPTKLGEAIDNLFDSKNLNVKIIKGIDGEFYNAVTVNSGNAEVTLFEDDEPIAEEDYKTAYINLRSMPQVFFSGILQEKLRQQMEADMRNPGYLTGFSKKLIETYAKK